MYLAVAHLSACGACRDGGMFSVETTLLDAGGNRVDDATVTCTTETLSFPGTFDRGTYVCGGGAGAYTVRVTWHGVVVASRAVEVPAINACQDPATVRLSFVLTSSPATDAGTSSDAAVDASVDP